MCTRPSTEFSNCTNYYPLEFNGTATKAYYAGGVIGYCGIDITAKDVTINGLKNYADLTFNGKSNNSTYAIGGAIGYVVAPVSESVCYGTITAMGQSGKTGMIMGVNRTDNIKATNCQVGGKLVTSLSEPVVDEESGTESGGGEELPGNITSSNWYKHIYATEVTETVATNDGCSLYVAPQN